MRATEGDDVGQVGDGGTAICTPRSTAPRYMVRSFCDHSGVPNPYVSRNGFAWLAVPGTGNGSTSTPPAPLAFIWSSSRSSSSLSSAASGSHQRYIGRTDSGGSANAPAVSSGAPPALGAATAGAAATS